jgi:hypothetical protein
MGYPSVDGRPRGCAHCPGLLFWLKSLATTVDITTQRVRIERGILSRNPVECQGQLPPRCSSRNDRLPAGGVATARAHFMKNLDASEKRKAARMVRRSRWGAAVRRATLGIALAAPRAGRCHCQQKTAALDYWKRWVANLWVRQ